MWNILSEEEQYLKENPDVTLKDWLEYKAKCKQEEKERRDAKIRKCQEWYESKIGKYFLIDFNSNSKIVGQLNKRNQDFKFSICYNIYSDKDWKFKIGIELNRFINSQWLHNPYELNNDSYVKIKEISKEQYNEIVQLYKATEEIYNKMKEML